MAWWDVCQPGSGTTCAPWNPTPGAGQRNDVSVPLPVGTTITSPVDGIVLPHHPGGGYFSYYGRQDWGGEVDIASYLPAYGGVKNVNILHLDTISVAPGTQVKKGDVIGTSGGQTSGGHWPSAPRWSTGPHVGIGVHDLSSWDAMRNPATLLSQLFSGVQSSMLPSQNQLQGSGIGDIPRGGSVPTANPTADTTVASSPCGQYNILDPRNWLCQLQQSGLGAYANILRYFQQSVRLVKLGAGVLLIIIAAGIFIAAPTLEAAGGITRNPALSAAGKTVRHPTAKNAGRTIGRGREMAARGGRFDNPPRAARTPQGRSAEQEENESGLASPGPGARPVPKRPRVRRRPVRTAP